MTRAQTEIFDRMDHCRLEVGRRINAVICLENATTRDSGQEGVILITRDYVWPTMSGRKFKFQTRWIYSGCEE